IIQEKEKLTDIKNDIYNMTLKLRNTSSQIKEEIESYLIIDELNYAKERLKFVLRNALTDADFLNENIENSFNLDLYYIDIHKILESEIFQWNNLYSVLSKRLNEIDSYLKEKIAEKEELRNLHKVLEQLEEKIFVFNESIKKKIDDFRMLLKELSKEGFTEENFSIMTQKFDEINRNVTHFDKKIYEISQNITPKEEIIIKKRNIVINNWLSLKSEMEDVFAYYLDGFDFYHEQITLINNKKNKIKENIANISEKAQIKIKSNRFQEAFSIIKQESDALLKKTSYEIEEIQNTIKDEIKKKHRLYLLFRYLEDFSEKFEEEIIILIDKQVQSLKNKVIEERNRAKIEDFDNFVADQISIFKIEINQLKQSLEQPADKKISDVEKGYDRLKNKFDKTHEEYIKKLKKCKEVIQHFEESNVTIVKWNNFYEYFIQEISILKEEYINNIITHKLYFLTSEKKTNNVSLIELKKELDLKCKPLIERIKDLIEISKINAELYENEKVVLVYTDDYYKNKELRNFIENKLLKLNQKAIGKVLALYDSSIRNRTLNINMLELENRIHDIKDFEVKLRSEFNKKISELQIIVENRIEYLETKSYFESILKNNEKAISSISDKLKTFSSMQIFIDQLYSDLKADLFVDYKKNIEEIETSQGKSYVHVKEICDKKWKKLENNLKEIQEKIDTELKKNLEKIKDSNKLTTELREISVKNKNIFLRDFQDKKDKVNGELTILKDEVLRDNLLTFINSKKIQMSQLLGTLQTRVEDDIEIKEFRRAYLKIHKRSKDIEDQVSVVSKEVKNKVKEFNRQSRNFEIKNKFILEDFDKFLSEFEAILTEKVKSLERLIIKSYVEMAIKAVANEFLTIGFLNTELKIKKQNLQDHLIALISDGSIPGKYDPRLGIYYENPEILDSLDEEELEVIKKMNFKVYMGITRLKNFTSQFGSIIAFFASIMTITYYFFIFSGGNPSVIAIPIGFFFLIVIYFLFKKREKDNVKF
ncbi:MAG: hypothetical protein ACFFAO_16910, partial [Candidatus Hermodarchaeota archaeon]